jgi:hypothetical protein
MPNYQLSKIYKLWSNQTDKIYIGCTTQPLAKRLGEHRRKYKLYQNGKYRYTTSFNILEYGDAKIELIEMLECKCKEELTAREGHYIRALECVNKVIPDRVAKSKYYQNNKARLTEKVKCDCGSVISRNGISDHKKTKKHMKYLETKNNECSIIAR